VSVTVSDNMKTILKLIMSTCAQDKLVYNVGPLVILYIIFI